MALAEVRVLDLLALAMNVPVVPAALVGAVLTTLVAGAFATLIVVCTLALLALVNIVPVVPAALGAVLVAPVGVVPTDLAEVRSMSLVLQVTIEGLR